MKRHDLLVVDLARVMAWWLALENVKYAAEAIEAYRPKIVLVHAIRLFSH